MLISKGKSLTLEISGGYRLEIYPLIGSPKELGNIIGCACLTKTWLSVTLTDGKSYLLGGLVYRLNSGSNTSEGSIIPSLLIVGSW